MAFERGKQRRSSRANPTSRKSTTSVSRTHTKSPTGSPMPGNMGLIKLSAKDRRLSTRDSLRRPSTKGGSQHLQRKPSLAGKKLTQAVVDKIGKGADEHNIKGKLSDFMGLKDAFDTSSLIDDDGGIVGAAVPGKSPASQQKKQSLSKQKQPEAAPKTMDRSASSCLFL